MPAPCCASPRVRRARRLVLLALILAAAILPLLAHGDDAVVAEALFLCDPLPPGGRDLNLSLAVEDGEALPRAQLAVALSERLGLTADVGLAPLEGGGLALDAPGASLKLLLRAGGPGRLGLAASLDLLGASDPADTAAALGLGLVRGAGPVTLRAGASISTALATAPTARGAGLHLGGSAAAALGHRVRVLAEAIAERADAAWALAAGPTLKVQLGEVTSLAVGALAGASPGAPPLRAMVQLTRGL